MNHIAKILGCGLALLALRNVAIADESPSSPAAPSADAQLAVQGNTEFALALYKKLGRGEEGNLFFAPYSISTVLAMAWGGARGETAAQMEKTLCFKLPQERLHPAMAGIQGILATIEKSGSVRMSSANSLWPQKGYAFRQEFLDLCQKQYGVSIVPVDYAQSPDQARRSINGWVKGKTNDLIPELFPAYSLTGMTRMVLVNAIYFKGLWLSPFMPASTQKNVDFTTASGRVAKVAMMNQEARFAYAEFPDLQVLSMPYRDSSVSMIVLLPTQPDGLPALQAKLTPDALKEWTGTLSFRQVKLAFPKFETAQQIALPERLQTLGMIDAFNPQKADFTGMTPPRELVHQQDRSPGHHQSR